MKRKTMYLTKNIYSRPGTKMEKVKGIVVHWIGNPGSTAEANRNYFEGLKAGQKMSNGKYRYASSHYIVGLDGEVVACVPEDEVAYHAGEANKEYIGIEVCHPDWSGKFKGQTYETLIELILDICKRYSLDPLTNVVRHYDITGKDCPIYYVKNPEAWRGLREDVSHRRVKPTQISVLLNGEIKEIAAINIEGNNYVALRGLEDEKIKIDYDQEQKLPIISVK